MKLFVRQYIEALLIELTNLISDRTTMFPCTSWFGTRNRDVASGRTTNDRSKAIEKYDRLIDEFTTPRNEHFRVSFPPRLKYRGCSISRSRALGFCTRRIRTILRLRFSRCRDFLPSCRFIILASREARPMRNCLCPCPALSDASDILQTCHELRTVADTHRSSTFYFHRCFTP